MNSTRKIIGLSFDLYLEFFVSQIPNFIQILSVLTILSSLLVRKSDRENVIFWILFILFFYLIQVGRSFLINNTAGSLSSNDEKVNKDNLNKIGNCWYVFVAVNTLLFWLLLNYLVNIIRPL